MKTPRRIQPLPAVVAIGAVALLLISNSAKADWKARLPDPVPQSKMDQAPYKYVGLIGSGCSGAVTKHPRVVLTAAHCIYDDDGDFTGLSPWRLRYNGTSKPESSDGVNLYCYRIFNDYVNYLEGSGDRNDSDAFNNDIAAVMAFQNLANGSAAPFYDDGADVLTSTQRDKKIIGYPTSIYSGSQFSPRPTPANETKKYRMHETSTTDHRFWKKTGTSHYYRVTKLSGTSNLMTAPGNSGGPVFVKGGNGVWGVAGVFVSVQRDHRIGTKSGGDKVYAGRAGARALTGGAISSLIDIAGDASNFDFSVSPLSRDHSYTGGNGTISVKMPSGCEWEYRVLNADEDDWVTFSGDGDRTGSKTISYQVAPNPSTSSRTAHLRVAKQTFTVTQIGKKTDLRDAGSSERELSHTTRKPGQKFTIRGDVTNKGTAPSGSFVVKFYASANNTISNSDVYLGQKLVQSISGEGTRSVDKQVTLPPNIAGGSYYVGWKLDSANAVAETNETNNVVIIGNPKLFVRRIDLKDRGSEHHDLSETEVHTANGFSVKGDVRNEGNAASGPFKVKFLASKVDNTIKDFLNGNGPPPAPKIEDGDFVISTRNIADVGKNSHEAIDSGISFPVGTPVGRYRIKWAIDADVEVAEMNENNNVVQISPQTIKVLPTIDLRDRGHQYRGLSHSERKRGQTLTIYGDVRNAGNTGAAAYTVKFYASTDASIDPDDDILLGQKSLPALPSGNLGTLDKTLVVPNSMPLGNYYIGWILDANGSAAKTQGLNFAPNGGGGTPDKPVELTFNNNVRISNNPDLKVVGLGLQFPPIVPGPDPIPKPELPIRPNPDTGGPDVKNPNNDPIPVVEISNVVHDGKTVSITFQTVKGYRYLLQESQNMARWTEISSISGTGAEATNRQRISRKRSTCFYRVLAKLEE